MEDPMARKAKSSTRARKAAENKAPRAKRRSSKRSTGVTDDSFVSGASTDANDMSDADLFARDTTHITPSMADDILNDTNTAARSSEESTQDQSAAATEGNEGNGIGLTLNQVVTYVRQHPVPVLMSIVGSGLAALTGKYLRDRTATSGAH
jgi:hypothetical protein